MRGKVSSLGDYYVGIDLEDDNDFSYGDEVTVRKLSVTPVEQDVLALTNDIAALRGDVDMISSWVKKLQEFRSDVLLEDVKHLERVVAELSNQLDFLMEDEGLEDNARANLARRVSSLEQLLPSYQPLWNERIETLDARLDHMDEAIKSLSVQRAQEISNDLKGHSGECLLDAARRHYNIHSCVTCKYAGNCAIQNAIDYDRSCRKLDRGAGGCSEYEVFEETYVADRDDIDRYEAE